MNTVGFNLFGFGLNNQQQASKTNSTPAPSVETAGSIACSAPAASAPASSGSSFSAVA